MDIPEENDKLITIVPTFSNFSESDTILKTIDNAILNIMSNSPFVSAENLASSENITQYEENENIESNIDSGENNVLAYCDEETNLEDDIEIHVHDIKLEPSENVSSYFTTDDAASSENITQNEDIKPNIDSCDNLHENNDCIYCHDETNLEADIQLYVQNIKVEPSENITSPSATEEPLPSVQIIDSDDNSQENNIEADITIKEEPLGNISQNVSSPNVETEEPLPPVQIIDADDNAQENNISTYCTDQTNSEADITIKEEPLENISQNVSSPNVETEESLPPVQNKSNDTELRNSEPTVAPVPDLQFKTLVTYRNKMLEIPQNLKDYSFALDENIWFRQYAIELGPDQRQFFRKLVVAEDQSAAVIFTSPTILQYVEQGIPVDLHMDAAYKVKPEKGAGSQLFFVHVQHDSTVYPIMYVLMERKTNAAYCAVLAALQQLAPNINIRSVMTDYEVALREAVRESFPEAELLGCWFHFARAVYKQAAAIGLTKKDADDVTRSIVKMAMVLPLLPRHLTAQGLQELREVAENKAEFETFFAYLEKCLADDISVYKQPPVANNAVESFHRDLLRTVSRIHPDIWVFTGLLQRLENLKAVDFLRSLDAAASSRRPRYKYQRLNQRIKSAQDILDGNGNVRWFLMHMTHPVRGLENVIRAGLGHNADPEELEHVPQQTQIPPPQQDNPPPQQQQEHIPPPEQQQEHIPPPAQQQKHISPPPQQQKHISPPPQQQKHITPSPQQQQHITPSPQQQQHIPPPPQQQKHISPLSQQQKHISPLPSQQKYMPPPPSQQQKHISPPPQQKHISPLPQQQKHISPLPQQQKHILPPPQHQQHTSLQERRSRPRFQPYPNPLNLLHRLRQQPRPSNSPPPLMFFRKR